jgi:RNA polymerase sigma factor (TIGR02999 family)
MDSTHIANSGGMAQVRQIRTEVEQGGAQAAQQLLPLVYDELRRLAAARLAREKPGQTLDATALVHEAFLKLVGSRPFANQQHFFRVAAEAMRQIVVDRARRHRCQRHGGDRQRVELTEVAQIGGAPGDNLLELDEALDRFASVDPQKAELVKLRYFAGLSEQEAADALGISRATANRYWTFARAWLINALDEPK